MSGMLERTIFDVLAAGREEATVNSDFLVKFFCSIGLSESEAEEIRIFWDSITVPNLKDPDKPFKGVDIIHQYPRGPNVVFPCWSIVLVSEAEGSAKEDRFLGDEADDLFDDLGNFQGACTASIWKSQYGIYVYAQSPDLCIYFYELCRFFMTRGRQFLKSESGGRVLDTAFSGADMMPDPRYVPENMFVRRFIVEAKKLQGVLSAVQPERGTKLGQVFLGPNPESQIEGIPNPGVTTYIKEEED